MLADTLRLVFGFLSYGFIQVNNLIYWLFPYSPWAGYLLILFSILAWLRNSFLRKKLFPDLKKTIWFPVLFTCIVFALHSAITLSTRL